MLYKKLDQSYQCLLCPHFCILEPNQTGLCSVRKANNNGIVLEKYGQLTNIVVEPIEKKPFFHFLSKSTTLSIGSNGCNLRCAFCENFEISQNNHTKISKVFNIKDIVNIALEKKCQSVCMTYNEPIICFEFLIDLAQECHYNNLKFIIKTNAYINEDPWKHICNNTDAINIDWKGYALQYREVCKADSYVIKERIQEAYDNGIHIEISIPLYHDFLNNPRIFAQCGSFLSAIDENIPCHLLKVFPANMMFEF